MLQLIKVQESAGREGSFDLICREEKDPLVLLTFQIDGGGIPNYIYINKEEGTVKEWLSKHAAGVKVREVCQMNMRLFHGGEEIALTRVDVSNRAVVSWIIGELRRTSDFEVLGELKETYVDQFLRFSGLALFDFIEIPITTRWSDLRKSTSTASLLNMRFAIPHPEPDSNCISIFDATTGEEIRWADHTTFDWVLMHPAYNTSTQINRYRQLDWVKNKYVLNVTDWAFHRMGARTREWKSVAECYGVDGSDVEVERFAELCIERIQIIPHLVSECQLLKCSMDLVLDRRRTRSLVSLIYRRCMEKGFILHQYPGEKEIITGGATIPMACRGLLDDPILVLDFASLYPSIIIGESICPTGNGVISSILKEWTEEREKATNEFHRTCLKLCSNSIYGLLGSSHSVLYSPKHAIQITSKGREQLEKARDLIDGEGDHLKVVYGFTDSLFVRVHGKPDPVTLPGLADYLVNLVNQALGSPYRLKTETIATSSYFEKNNHYALLDPPNGVKFVGLGPKRTADPRYITEAVSRKITALLCNKKEEESTYHPNPEDYAYTIKISRGESTGEIQRQLKAKLSSQELNELRADDRIEYVKTVQGDNVPLKQFLASPSSYELDLKHYERELNKELKKIDDVVAGLELNPTRQQSSGSGGGTRIRSEILYPRTQDIASLSGFIRKMCEGGNQSELPGDINFS